MQHIKRFLWIDLLALTGLWWATDQTDFTSLPHFFAWREVLMQYTGVLAIGVMSAGMVLAVRPVWFEPWLGGLVGSVPAGLSSSAIRRAAAVNGGPATSSPPTTGALPEAWPSS